MSFMERMPITRKLALMVLVPIIGLLFFLQSVVRHELSVRTDSSGMLYIAETSVAVSALVHELQKERGMSAGYLGSKGKKFSSELPAHQAVTDSRIKVLKETAANIDSGFASTDLGGSFSRNLQKKIDALDKLAAMRSGIRQLSVSAGEGIGFYTALNSGFLDLTALSVPC